MATSLKNIPFVNPVPQMSEDGALIIDDVAQFNCAYMKYDSAMNSVQLYTCSDGNMTYVPVEMARYATCGFGDPQMGTYVDACIYIDASMRYIEFCNGADSVPVYCACYASCADSAYGIGVSFESYGCYHYGSTYPCIDCYGNIQYFQMYDQEGNEYQLGLIACGIRVSFDAYGCYHYGIAYPCIDCYGNIQYFQMYDQDSGSDWQLGLIACGIGVWNECDGSIHMIAPCMYACEYGGWCYWDGSWFDYTCGQTFYSQIMYACCACIAYALDGYDPDQYRYYQVTPCIYNGTICFVGYSWEGTCYFNIMYACYAEVLSWYDQNEQRSYTAQPITYDELTSNPSNYKILAAPIN